MKNYYNATKAEFDAFVEGKTLTTNLKDALAAVSAGPTPTEENPAVIFELTNTIRPRKQRIVASGLVVESNRRLGPREKKEVDPNAPPAEPKKTRKGRKSTEATTEPAQ